MKYKGEKMFEPKKCPVCEGCGTVPYDFYKDQPRKSIVTPGSREQCRTCNGGGVLWINESIYPLYQYVPPIIDDTSTQYAPYDPSSAPYYNNPCENCPVRLSPTFNGVCHCTLPYMINPPIIW